MFYEYFAKFAAKLPKMLKATGKNKLTLRQRYVSKPPSPHTDKPGKVVSKPAAPPPSHAKFYRDKRKELYGLMGTRELK